MNFKALFYMALNRTAGSVESCSDDEFDVEVYQHGKLSFESLL